jgi:hypothetical protein
MKKVLPLFAILSLLFSACINPFMKEILDRGKDNTVSGIDTEEMGDPQGPQEPEDGEAEGGDFPEEPEGEYKDIPAGLYLNSDFDNPIDVSGEAGANIVEKAIAYVNTAANAEKGAYTLLVGEDTVIGPQIISTANLNLTLQGTGVERVSSFSGNPGDTSSFIYIDTGATLVLDRNITLQGNSNNNFNALVWVYSNGTLEMNEGAKITGHSANCGGGVMVYGTFIMNGGAISGNTAENGGGVRVEEGTFSMNGGEISGNKSDSGGGVSALYGANFTMNGGAISGNAASSHGGGVYVNDAAVRIVNGMVYGSNEADIGLKNTAAEGAALYKSAGSAECGTFNGTIWEKIGDLLNTDDTIRVINGKLR